MGRPSVLGLVASNNTPIRIGIGGSGGSPPLPSHTTGHAGPHPAVREVEVAPHRCRCVRLSARFHACSSGSHRCAVPSDFTCALQRELRKADIWCNALPHCVSVALSLSFGPSSQLRLLWPLLTSRSADASARQRRPFRRKARSPQVRMVAFPAQPPDLHHLSLGRESFAVSRPLALLGNASYPVRIPRLAGSLAASFSGPLTVAALRFAWVATTNSPGDFHPQVTIHAGHTRQRPGPTGGPAVHLPAVSTKR